MIWWENSIRSGNPVVRRAARLFLCSTHCNFNFRQDAREAAAFIRPMLKMDPEKRASAQEMLDHPWLEELEPAVDEVSKSSRQLWASEACLRGTKSSPRRVHPSYKYTPSYVAWFLEGSRSASETYMVVAQMLAHVLPSFLNSSYNRWQCCVETVTQDADLCCCFS